MQSLLRRGTSFLSSVSSFKEQEREQEQEQECSKPALAPEHSLFPKVDPAIDGEDCDHDCSSCTIRFPSKFSIDLEDKLYGNVEQWATHLLVATGKTDWVRDVADEEGSVMQAIERGGVKPSNGKLMLSASNIPVPDEYHTHDLGSQPTTVLLLPSFTIIDHVTPSLAPDLINYFVNPAPTTTTLLDRPFQSASDASPAPSIYSEPEPDTHLTTPTTPISTTSSPCPSLLAPPPSNTTTSHTHTTPLTPSALSSLTPLTSRPCPHSAVILLCSQRTRDIRCGQSAPLLKREFERHLRMHGLYRDMNDDRPGGVGIYFISHVGGHRYSANVMVYRRRDFEWFRREEGEEAGREDGEGAAQGIWLARVKPADCEGIIKYTVLQGKVVKPEMQLRGGFDREKGLVSW
ncbi:hypothetical protein FQN54_005791 [Arachnomyces sp. PD_36]|nr:hypothetical protein FQN54_005791 [Arachnomyces sp. PD_36]